MIFLLFHFLVKRDIQLEQCFNISLLIGSLIYILALNNSYFNYYSSFIIPIDLTFFLKKYFILRETTKDYFPKMKKNYNESANPVLKQVPLKVNKIYPKEELEKNNYIPTKLDIHYTMKQTLENLST